MKNKTAETGSRLAETVRESRQWLLELDEVTIRHKPSADRWSIAEVIGHLIDSACNNHQRYIRGQELNELVFPYYDQNSWIAKNNYQETGWGELVEFWSSYNLQLARIMDKIPVEKYETPCTITPYETCTLGFLVTDYLDHLNHHLDKIRERVGKA